MALAVSRTPSFAARNRSYSRTTFCASTLGRDEAVAQPEGVVAERGDVVERVAAEEDRPAGALQVEDPVDALLLEPRVAHGEGLVEDDDVGEDRRGDGEREAHRHPRGVGLHRPFEELAQLGERLDLGEGGVDLGAREARQRRLEHRVLPARHLRVERGPQLQDRGDAARDRELSGRGRSRPGEDLQEGALARAVLPDEAHHLPALEPARDASKGVHRLVSLPAGDGFDQPVGRARVDAVDLREVLKGECGSAHRGRRGS